jgi:hypothetical protein
MGGEAECRVRLYALFGAALCEEGFVNKHRECIIVFWNNIFCYLLLSLRPACVLVYLRYLNFIYSVCAFQMAYITRPS